MAHLGGCGKGDALGHRHGSRVPVVVPGAQSTCFEADPFVDIDDIEAADPEPEDAFLDVFDGPALAPDQDVEDLGDVDDAQQGWIGPIAEQRLDLRSGRFARQGRDDGFGIEDGQVRLPRRPSISASSLRRTARISVLVGPRPDRDPIAAPIGSSGMGRITSAEPLSSIATLAVCQRCLTSAGMDT